MSKSQRKNNLGKTGRMRNLLGISGLSVNEIRRLLDRGKFYKSQLESGTKKFDVLAGRSVVNLFYEPSTRTRSSFEMAAKRLGADTIQFNADSTTSVVKGETLVDTARTLEAMNPDFLRQ